MTTITPIFIFSLPRSGSTLLQQMLASHNQIASVAEPWILLPLASMVESDNVQVFANYSNNHAQLAIEQFINNFPDKKNSFYSEIENFVTRLYSLASSEDAVFFLDKTPRYYLIIDFIAQVFPDAKFIFLFRNPLDILSSIITTWGGNKLHITHWAVDLFRGPFCLFDGYHKYINRSIVIQYEELVSSPSEQLGKLCDFLGIGFSPSMLSEWKKNRTQGLMGDTKTFQKSAIETSSVKRWARTLNTQVRRLFARWYIRYLGSDLLKQFGFDESILLQELQNLNCSWDSTLIDAYDILTAVLGRFLSIKIFKNQARRGIWKSELFA